MKSKIMYTTMTAIFSFILVSVISAQEKYPMKPITFIIHASAGSNTDIMARQLGKAAEPILGQTVVVENRPGGNGAVQVAALLSSPTDGYTLAAVTPTHIGAWETTQKGKFNIDQFAWIARIQIDPYLITVQAKSPFKTLKDLVEYGKQNPNKLKIGGYGGAGSGPNVAFNIFAEAADLKAVWMPYNGTNDAVVALLGGHVDAANSSPGQVIQHVEAGKLRILGVMTPKRLEGLPDVPTYAETGYPVEEGWVQFRGIYGRKGIPKPIQTQLSEIFLKATKSSSFQNYMKNTQQEDGSMGNEEFTAFIKQQRELTIKWYKRLGIIK